VIEALGEDEQEAVHREYMALKNLPGMIGGASLHPVETATTIRVQDDHVLVTDGPCADTKEIFAGFYLLEADDLDQATEIAAARRQPPVSAAWRQPPVSIDLMLNEGSKPRNCCMTSTTRCSRIGSTLPAGPLVNG
jgi:hypothetical protein